jgi:hypothetical protein
MKPVMIGTTSAKNRLHISLLGGFDLAGIVLDFDRRGLRATGGRMATASFTRRQAVKP